MDAFEEIDKLKEILEKLEKNYNFAKVTEEDLNEKLNYITRLQFLSKAIQLKLSIQITIA